MNAIVMGGRGDVHEQHAQATRWTKAKRAAFLDQLEVTGNMALSCERVAMSYDGMRKLRHRDTEFDAAVRDALAAGYERLENDLLARAIMSDRSVKAGEAERHREIAPMDDATKLRILQMQDARIGSGQRRSQPARRTDAEVMESLLKKLGAIAAAIGVAA